MGALAIDIERYDRNYNPVTGRWMQKDPIGFGLGDVTFDLGYTGVFSMYNSRLEEQCHQ